jgi:predicted membrane channel-forming protein YqfA (hemolysin III family)
MNGDSRRYQAPEKEGLKDEMQSVVEEARMVLPGVQALFGFQTMAVFNARFDTVPPAAKVAYLIALAFLVIAMGLLMSPAAYHRLAERGRVSRQLIDLSSRFITSSMLPLALALAIDVYVVTSTVLNNNVLGLAGAMLTCVFLAGFWYVFPLMRKATR